MSVEWFCCHKNVNLRPILSDMLPQDMHCKVVGFNIIEQSEISIETKYEAKLWIKACKESDVTRIITSFGENTCTTYNTLRGDYRNGKKFSLTGSRKCHHFTRKRSLEDGEKQKGKNTNCPASISFKLLRNDHDHSDDDICTDFNLEMNISYIHNHCILAADSLRFHVPCDETKVKFHELFDSCGSPSISYYDFRKHLEQEHGNDFITVSANRSIMPTYSWVYYEFNKYKKEKFGSLSGPDMFMKTHEECKKYNDEHQAELAHFRQTDSGDFYIVITDPLQLRVHKKLPSSGDVALIDGTSNLDRNDSKLFRIVTPSAIGAMPLATIVTSRESEEILTLALELLKEKLPDYAWYGRGKLGPKHFISDDAAAEIAALR